MSLLFINKTLQSSTQQLLICDSQWSLGFPWQNSFIKRTFHNNAKNQRKSQLIFISLKINILWSLFHVNILMTIIINEYFQIPNFVDFVLTSSIDGFLIIYNCPITDFENHVPNCQKCKLYIYFYWLIIWITVHLIRCLHYWITLLDCLLYVFCSTVKPAYTTISITVFFIWCVQSHAHMPAHASLVWCM